jgi:hypothetical protein
MENLRSLASSFPEELKKRAEAHPQKIEYEFQELGLEMAKFFPKDQHKLMWSLFTRPGYTEDKVRKAFAICERKEVHNVLYLIGIIKKMDEQGPPRMRIFRR